MIPPLALSCTLALLSVCLSLNSQLCLSLSLSLLGLIISTRTPKTRLASKENPALQTLQSFDRGEPTPVGY